MYLMALFSMWELEAIPVLCQESQSHYFNAGTLVKGYLYLSSTNGVDF
jgi:hypothetical protein